MTKTPIFRRGARAFTLLEILIVAIIIVMVAGLTLTDSLESVVRKKLDVEDSYLTQIERDIKASFENTDLTNTNIAAFAGEIGAADTPTTFSTATAPVYGTTNVTDWFAKIARVRGTSVQIGVAPTQAAQPELSRILFNRNGNARLLVAAPAEFDKQRFLLISLMADSSQLTLPAYQPTTAWFDAIWNTDFGSRQAFPPALWAGLLSAGQLAQWNGDSSGTNLYRLRVKRITLPRFSVTVNNNHLTKSAWVYANNNALTFLSTPGSGATQTVPILAGRQIRVTCGTAVATAMQTHLFFLRENAVVDVDSL